MNTKNLIQHTHRYILLIFGILLLLSVLWSGFHMVLDNDELAHSHMSYLLANGLLPYRDYFASVYTPLFHLFLLPFFLVAGFTIQSIVWARVVMILLYLLRIGLVYLIVKKLFTAQAAVLSIVLNLWDAFSVITAMQVRPDNLMLTLFLVATFLLIGAYEKNDRRLAWFSGICSGLSCIILPKIIPSVIALGLGMAISKHKRQLILPNWIIGGVTAGLVFFGFLASNGIAYSFWHQAVVNSLQFYNAHIYPVYLGFFYKPDNTLVFGFGGRPVTWVYVWVLPMLASLGFCIAFLRRDLTNSQKVILAVRRGMMLALLFQFASLFAIRSVFIQYYVPVTYLFAIFGAVAVDHIYTALKGKYVKGMAGAIAIGIFLLLSFRSIEGNLLRIQYNSSEEQVKQMTRTYAMIPESAHVFPVGLFRPLTYPLWYGLFWGDIPQGIQKEFPPMLPVLEKPTTRYVLTNEYEIRFYPQNVQQYITDHFYASLEAKNLWIRE